MVAKTLRSTMLGKVNLRLAQDGVDYFGLADGKIVCRGDDADQVWRQLHDEAGKAGPKYVGFPGAINRFLQFFPNGFQSAGFESQERAYKITAKAKLDNAAPLSQALQGEASGEAILAAYRATNLLYPVEKTRLQALLRGPDGTKFAKAAASFAEAPSAAHLRDMREMLLPHDNAKWTVVTYLPFLWKPAQNMFLKPEVTKDFAERVGHPFAGLYEAGLNYAVYESLLDLAEKAEVALKSLAPRDRIDIQSFVWIVGDYREGREGTYS